MLRDRPLHFERTQTRSQRASGLASIIVPCRDQLPFTRECLKSLAEHTTAPWELVIVDDGSRDGTADYLNALQDADPKRVAVVTHTASQGFPTSCNHGLEAARGDYLVLLNNDTVVTHGWLDHLIALAESDPEIGMVGPVSNYVSPPQLIPEVSYRSLDKMHAFAAVWRGKRLGQWMLCEKLSGFCLLIKRAAYEKLGGLDERFGLGFFDDDDLCLRARKAGYKLAVAIDCFVHHFGSRTISAVGINAESLLQTNSVKFAEKWGRDALAARAPVSITPWNEGTTQTLAKPSENTRQLRVSLTMIVKNEEHNLPVCLESARGLFDEINILDTGSTDRTVEIALSFGARVFDFVWVDDFAAARNAVLARATGDYAFWLDADDVIPPRQRDGFKNLFDMLLPGDDASYVIHCSCDPDENGGGGATLVNHVRLFPIRENVRWTYRVHEQILPGLRRAGIPDRWTNLAVRHTGYSDPDLRARKLIRDENILYEELADRPDDPFVLFNLGAIAVEREEWQGALARLRKSLSLSAPEDSITRKLYALIARAHQGTGDTRAAIDACEAGLEIDPHDAELWFRKAVAHRARAENTEAETCWRKILGLHPQTKYSSVDIGIYGHLTRRNLATLALERGDHAEALSLCQAILKECRDDPGALKLMRQLEASPGPSMPAASLWIIDGSSRHSLPPASAPCGEFAPFAGLATNWVRTLKPRVIVELGARFGETTRGFLKGIAGTDGHVWAIDPYDRHGVDEPAFTYIQADPRDFAERFDAIDFLHIDVDANTIDLPSHWLAVFAPKARVVALHDTHHPLYRTGAAAKALAAEGGWRAFEYWDGRTGWTVLARDGVPTPHDEGDAT